MVRFVTSFSGKHYDIYAKKMLEHVGLGSQFSSIFGYDSVSKPKPHPEAVEKKLADFVLTASGRSSWKTNTPKASKFMTIWHFRV